MTLRSYITASRRAVGDDPSGVHANQALGDPQQDVHDVLDPDDRDAVAFQFENHVDEFARLARDAT